MMNVKTSIAMVLLIGLASAEANLLSNGDFEQGDTGFETSYTPDPSPTSAPDPLPGQYFVGNNSKTWNGNFPTPIYDHTSGSGLMLMADGTPNTTVWQQSIPVVGGTEYQFSAWYTELGTFNPSRLEFLIDGNSLGTVDSSYNNWQEFSTSWVAPQSGASVLTIRDLRSGDLGNDFALDDLSFEAIPEPASAAVFGISAFGAIWIRKRRKFKTWFMFYVPPTSRFNTSW